MNQGMNKRIGLLIGREWDWPSAFMDAVDSRQVGITAELVKIGGTSIEDDNPYAVIIDRMSHEIPYYRTYLKHAVVQGSYVIDNPFTWSFDSRFFGHVIINKLGLPTPRTVILPNKEVERDVVPDSFRNLKYPMDWQGIIDHVGVPAILKDVRVGGRRIVYRVNSVDELIQRYDESETRTMIVQTIIEADTHVHGFVVGQEDILLLRYSLSKGRYLHGAVTDDERFYSQLLEAALTLTRTYNYDINMVEFVVRGDEYFVINSTNPAPVIDRDLMTSDQFNWLVQATVELAIDRAQRPLQNALFNFPT